ncbi:MAG: HigA family addiction module antidote protein [Gammaproteobacteria bacterium]|nr:HigA family addiction module antidote protein [Gammaproteobacteria bacterium]
MIPQNRVSTHPGKILLHEFLEPLKLTQKGLAEHLGIPTQRINELVRGKRGVTPDTAWLLAGAFNTSAEFWMNLQVAYDLSSSRLARVIRPLIA